MLLNPCFDSIFNVKSFWKSSLDVCSAFPIVISCSFVMQDVMNNEFILENIYI